MRTLSHFITHMQQDLFPELEEVLGVLSPAYQELVKVLEILQIERMISAPREGTRGRPVSDRRPIVRAFIAKAVLGFSSTRILIQTLQGSPALRKICGWSQLTDLPGESTFSRAFGEFARSCVGQIIHQQLVEEVFQDHIVGHIARDSTAIEAPERPPSRKISGSKGPTKRSDRVKRQAEGMDLTDMVAELPTHVAWGCKTNSRGHRYFWSGYKLHVDWSDCGIPISCLLTSASLHDSQAAIPLATMSHGRVTSLYDLMDSAYDSKHIREHSQTLGHVPVIEIVRRTRSDKRPDHPDYRVQRLRVRTAAERGFSNLKESFGARFVRTRGAEKVMAHLMFGILALTAARILTLLI